MDARSEAKLNMYRTVERILDNHPSIVSSNLAFALATNSFKAHIADILSEMTLHSERLTGIAKDKKSNKEILAQTATDIAVVLFAYASSSNDNSFTEAVNYSYTDLYRIQDELLSPVAQNIYNSAAENLPALLSYGITPAILAGLQAAISQYSNAVAQPRIAAVRKQAQGKNIQQLIRAIDLVVKTQPDKLINMFKTAHPDFVGIYRGARSITDPGTYSTQLKGHISDKHSGRPIINAQIQVTNAPSFTTSDADGNYLLKPLKKNIYSISFTKAGYEPQTREYVIVKLKKKQSSIFNW